MNPVEAATSQPTLVISQDSSTSSKVLMRSRASQNYYCLQLPLNRVHLIENSKGIDSFLKYLRDGQDTLKKSAKKEVLTVGFDAEWKPVNPGIEGVALIQVALQQDVFLIDCIKLKEIDQAAQARIWKALLDEFFSNEVNYFS